VPAVRPLSVLFLNPIGARDWGGVETWMLEAATGLAARGHSVAACSRPGGLFLDRFSARGVPTESIPFRRDLGPIQAFHLRRILARHDVDVIVTKLSKGLRVAALARVFGARAAVVERQGKPSDLKEGFRHRLTHRIVDRVITPARAVRDAIAESGSFPADRVDEVRNGVDAARFRPAPARRAALRRQLGLPAGPLLASTGRLHDQKGYDLLVRALARLPSDVHAAVAGRGKQEAAIRRLAKEVGVSERLHLLGHLDDVSTLLGAADVFVLPSREEGMPNSLLEAMAAGLPAVVARTGDVARMVGEGRAGRIVPPEDVCAFSAAVRELLGAPDTAREIGEAARRTAVRSFPVKAMVDGTEACLMRAVGLRSSRPRERIGTAGRRA